MKGRKILHFRKIFLNSFELIKPKKNIKNKGSKYF